jgi:competence protein ComFC
MYGIINKTNVQNVKSTMIDTLFSYLAPHPCCSCGKLGSLLCDNCKYNIICEISISCMICGAISANNGICSTCTAPYSKAWCVGERTDELKRLIDGFKFENKKEAYKPLGDLLDACVAQLPEETVIVAIPTTSAHIRVRGYDHALLVGKYFAAKRGLTYRPVLQRRTNTSQRNANRKERLLQAKMAFKTTGNISDNVPYLLIDDITTTGATLHFAAKALRAAGATTVWVATIARQPLD